MAIRLEIELYVKCFGDLPPLPRLGLTLSLPSTFEHFTWLGRGPEESYNDRKAGVPVGLHRSTVAEQYVPYIMPQEHGNKTDVRWAALSNAEGTGLLVAGEHLIQVSASHFTEDDLYRAVHTNELSPRVWTGADPVDSWKSKVSDEQRQRTLAILNLFGLDRIYGADAMPRLEGVLEIMNARSTSGLGADGVRSLGEDVEMSR